MCVKFQKAGERFPPSASRCLHVQIKLSKAVAADSYSENSQEYSNSSSWHFLSKEKIMQFGSRHPHGSFWLLELRASSLTFITPWIELDFDNYNIRNYILKLSRILVYEVHGIVHSLFLPTQFLMKKKFLDDRSFGLCFKIRLRS